MPILTVAVFGGGVVGGGVVELLNRIPHLFYIKYIVVKSKNKSRDYSIPANTILTDDPSVALRDPDVHVYCELVGGDFYGRLIFNAAVANKKHYVTANKSFLAENLNFVESALLHTKACLFEAAVCGGIPVIGILRHTGDEISEIRGIVNGSTNYLLDRMTSQGIDYVLALSEAQTLGYLEADPSSDVLGLDARHKIIILARLAMGVRISEHQIPTKGITEITAVDINAAQGLNRTIKLIASAKRSEIFVWPCLVSNDSPLAKIGKAGNAVELVGKNVGKQLFTGAGAGRFPTANSVVADLLEISRIGDGNYNTFARPLMEASADRDGISGDVISVLYIRSTIKPSVPCEEVGEGIYVTKTAVSLMQMVAKLPDAFVALVLSHCFVICYL